MAAECEREQRIPAEIGADVDDVRARPLAAARRELDPHVRERRLDDARLLQIGAVEVEAVVEILESGIRARLHVQQRRRNLARRALCDCRHVGRHSGRLGQRYALVARHVVVALVGAEILRPPRLSRLRAVSGGGRRSCRGRSCACRDRRAGWRRPCCTCSPTPPWWPSPTSRTSRRRRRSCARESPIRDRLHRQLLSPMPTTPRRHQSPPRTRDLALTRRRLFVDDHYRDIAGVVAFVAIGLATDFIFVPRSGHRCCSAFSFSGWRS